MLRPKDLKLLRKQRLVERVAKYLEEGQVEFNIMIPTDEELEHLKEKCLHYGWICEEVELPKKYKTIMGIKLTPSEELGD